MSDEKKKPSRKAPARAQSTTPLNTPTPRARTTRKVTSAIASTPEENQLTPAIEPAAAAPPPPKPRARAAKKPATAPKASSRPAETPAAPVANNASVANKLSIVMVTSEAHPFAKTGGLAEVAGALPDALGRLGHDVTIVLPRYRGIAVKDARSRDLVVPMGSVNQAAVVHEVKRGDRVTVALIDVPELFDREGLYGTAAGDFPDNAWRFAVFSRAALEYLRVRGERPSIIHAHDWQAGLVPVYQKMLFSNDPVVGGVPVVFTIHNLAFQGNFQSAILPHIGLGWEVLVPNALEFWGQVSYLKGGVNFSEKITTVSPTYSREILQPEFAFGFQGVLARRADDLLGIVNGIDIVRWNPEHDPLVPASYSADRLDAKAEAKAALLRDVNLPADDEALRKPVIGLVSRLTDQKGLDLIGAAAGELMALDATWVMLGSGEPHYEDLWRTLARRHPDRVSATIGFDERLAHLIEAGSDLFLMPSRWEPCGLNQLYSLRYGTVPVVRATGGLEDTVQDYDPATSAGTGFKFRDYSPQAMVGAIRRALAVYPDRTAWRRIQQAGMRQDPSWDASAREYVKVYEVAAEDLKHGI
jgi:starch synthase